MTDLGYGDVAFEYHQKGWAPLPLVRGTKAKGLPSGYTGYGYREPSGADIAEWIDINPQGNICVHLPSGLVGIDVDNYSGKNGGATLNEAIRRWGPLPETVIATSREDKVSGIRFFTVPEDSHLETTITFSNLGLSNIEIIQDYHRYAVVYPSMHPTTRLPYLWFDAHWNRLDEIPSVATLPALPDAWVQGLSRSAQADITVDADAAQALSSLVPGPPSARVKAVLSEAIADLKGKPESRHDQATRSVAKLLRLGEQQEPGVSEALAQLGEVFVTRTADRNTPEEAREEYRRMVMGTRVHSLIASTPSAMKSEDLIGANQGPGVDAGPTPAEAVDRVRTELPATDVPTFAGLQRDQESGQGKVSTADHAAATRNVIQGPSLTVTDHAAAIRNLPLGDSIPLSMWDSYLGDGTVADSTPETPTAVVDSDTSHLPFYDQLLDIDGLRNVLPAAPMVEGLLYRNTLAQVSGKPGSYKSFFTLGLACAVASPLTKWQARPIVHHGPVIYVAAEGVSGMRVRVEAWCQDTGVRPEDLNIKFFPRPFEIDDYDHVAQVKDMVRRSECVLLVIDTRARVNGDLDENSASDQGKAIKAIEEIRAETQATVLVVHHTGKAGVSGGGRGSNAWDGAVWTEMLSHVDDDGHLVVHVEKHKDAPKPEDLYYDLATITVNQDRMPEYVDEVSRQSLVLRDMDPQVVREPKIQSRDTDKLIRFMRDSVMKSGIAGGQLIASMVDDDMNNRLARRVLTYAENRGWIEQRGRYYHLTDAGRDSNSNSDSSDD